MVIDAHLHVGDGTAAGRDPGPMKVGDSAQATASVELFRDYMDEAGVERAVFVQPWFYFSQAELDAIMGGTAAPVFWGQAPHS